MLCGAKETLNLQGLGFRPLSCRCAPGPALCAAPSGMVSDHPSRLLGGATRKAHRGTEAPLPRHSSQSWDGECPRPGHPSSRFPRLRQTSLPPTPHPAWEWEAEKKTRRMGKTGGGGGWGGRSWRLAPIPVQSWLGALAQASPSDFPPAAPRESRKRLPEHERSARPAPLSAGSILGEKVR